MKTLTFKPRTALKKLASSLGLDCRWPHSYSQEGEDLVLARYFAKSSLIYVDVGAHHPTRYSNTYLFYSQGWRGINIDAMPGSMDAFRRDRPRDINIEALVSTSKKPTITFDLMSLPLIPVIPPSPKAEMELVDIV